MSGKTMEYGNLTTTRWTEAAAAGETLGEYPRPQMVREQWMNLNGLWEYAFTDWEAEPKNYEGEILVPFSPEAPLSGVHRQLQPGEYLWYRRTVRIPVPVKGHRVLLHFGAVDQMCTVYADGRELASNCGGYLPFTVDITRAVEEAQPRTRIFREKSSGSGNAEPADESREAAQITLTVRVQDTSDTSYHSRGKQKLERGGMYYTAQSGIWQTVWAEEVPARYIDHLQIMPDLDRRLCRIRVFMAGDALTGSEEMILHLKAAGDTTEVYFPDRSGFTFWLERGDDWHLWTPEDPYLYHFRIEAGEDEICGYLAMRCCTCERAEDGFQRFFLNHEPCLMTGVLDQGYWPDGLLTAPSDEAMIYDIQTMKDLGYNMIRKHIKIEPERWYYHCDRLGMLVWQDMVNGGTSYQDWFVTYLATAMNAHHLPFSDRGPISRKLLSRVSVESREEYRRELCGTVEHLYNHPSIVCWVPFNEGWGQFDARKAAVLLKKKDATRWVDHASGWYDQKAGDVISLHHYYFKLRFRPEKKRVLALTEFGGYTWQVPGHTWGKKLYGYGASGTQEGLTGRYRERWIQAEDSVLRGISALIYTQLSDIEDESNGILTYDREFIKIPAEKIREWNEEVREEFCDLCSD